MESENYVRCYTKNEIYTGKHVTTKLWVGDYTTGDTFEKLAEQAKINVQAVAPLRAQYEAQKVQMQQMKDKFLADKDHLERLTIGAELNRAPMNRLVTIHIGDDMNELLGGEILVEDGKIVEFRN